MAKLIRASHPKEGSSQFIQIQKTILSEKEGPISVYEAVDYFKNHVFDRQRYTERKTKNKHELANIVNLHNLEGIRDPEQIKKMTNDIPKGTHIVHENGMPNVKVVLTDKDQYLLFDGHHSLLAYIYSGKKFLSEIPYLLVANFYRNKYLPLSDEEIATFFGEHQNLKPDWRKKVINWQMPKAEQLADRIENNIGELYESFKDYISEIKNVLKR